MGGAVPGQTVKHLWRYSLAVACAFAGDFTIYQIDRNGGLYFTAGTFFVLACMFAFYLVPLTIGKDDPK